MPNAFETPWVTLEVNDAPLSLCNDLGRPNYFNRKKITLQYCDGFCHTMK